MCIVNNWRYDANVRGIDDDAATMAIALNSAYFSLFPGLPSTWIIFSENYLKIPDTQDSETQ